LPGTYRATVIASARSFIPASSVGGDPSHNSRFQSLINQIAANKNSTQKFICSTLVWRAYLEGTGHTLDISDPNNMSATPRSIRGQIPLGFIDQLRPVFVVPETFARSPKLKQNFNFLKDGKSMLTNIGSIADGPGTVSILQARREFRRLRWVGHRTDPVLVPGIRFVLARCLGHSRLKHSEVIE
jgi:hypothetical protein